MKRTIKHIICGAALLAGALSGVSCSEWTENEKIAVKDPVFGESNPELYARYVAELRAWKQSEHQRTIVWFDNSNKQPASRGGFFSDVPDSVDIVALKASGRLTASELEQVASLHEKGTRVIGAFDCTALLASGEEGDGAGESAEGTSDAATRLRTALETRMAEVEADALDGFTLRYEPTDITFATDEERTVQLALDAVVAEALKGWRQRHPEALLLFEGTPQYFSDVEAAALCDYLVVRCLDAESVYDFGMRARRMCGVAGLPTDRFVWLVSAVPPASTDTTGYLLDESGASVRALGALAEWMLRPEEFGKAAVGIMDVQYDYYNSTMIYRYTKEAIKTLNPSPKN